MEKLSRWSSKLLCEKKKQQKCEREKTDEIRNDKAVWAEEEIFKRRIVVTKRKGKIS